MGGREGRCGSAQGMHFTQPVNLPHYVSRAVIPAFAFPIGVDDPTWFHSMLVIMLWTRHSNSHCASTAASPQCWVCGPAMLQVQLTWWSVLQVAVPEWVTSIRPGANPDYHAQTLRLVLSSPIMPDQECDVHLANGEVTMLTREVVEGYDPGGMACQQLWVEALDGVQVGIQCSVVSMGIKHSYSCLVWRMHCSAFKYEMLGCLSKASKTFCQPNEVSYAAGATHVR